VTITRCTFHWKASLTLTALEKAWPPTYGDATEILMIGCGAVVSFFNCHDDANFIANKVLSAPPKLRAARWFKVVDKRWRGEQKGKTKKQSSAVAILVTDSCIVQSPKRTCVL
jgi:hypothetical protein